MYFYYGGFLELCKSQNMQVVIPIQAMFHARDSYGHQVRILLVTTECQQGVVN